MIKTIHNIYFILEKAEKVKFFKLSILMIISSVLETVGIASIFPLINFLTDNNTNFDFLDQLGINKLDIEINLSILIVGIFIIYLLKNIYLGFFYWFENKFSYSTRFNLGNRLFSKYLNSSYSFHLENNSSNLVTKVVQETALYGGALASLGALITELLLVLSLTILLMVIKPFETICVFLIIILFGLIYFFFSKKIISKLGNSLLTAQRQKMKVLNESLRSITEIIIFGVKNYFIKRFSKRSIEVSKLGYKMAFINRLPKIWFEFGAIFIIFFIIIYANYQKSSNTEIIATLGIFLLSALKIIPSINKILISIQSIKYAESAIESICNDLFSDNDNDNYKYKDNNDKIKFEKNIVFKNVNLKFTVNKEEVLKDINLEINKKDFIAIIGKTGSGKTTFLNLLMGLVIPTSGSIQIDGYNLNEYIFSWRKKIGFVPQSISLLEDSLEKNIAYGVEEDQISQEKIVSSLNLSRLIDFKKDNINDLLIGEDGEKISGGQRQRLAIARALYTEPEVLIFDEPTSALDEETSKELFKTLKELNLTKTIIIVSHDIKNLDMFNKVFKIKERKVLQIK